MSGTLAGKRILVIEDEYFIASDMKRALEAENADVIGPVGDLGQGMALLAGGIPDAAVLDINLGGAYSYPIADILAANAVPYMFLTGYDDWMLPDAYRAVPHVAKPFAIHAVLATIEKLVGAREPA
jgi:DNA-binding response OmpR family regulator